MNRKADIIAEAQALADQGAGYEDILVLLGRTRITRLEARTAVFGPYIARRMELRDAVRTRNGPHKRLPEATRRWLENAS